MSEADKVYGVTHANRTSEVDVITKADALQFLQAAEEAQAAAARREQQQRLDSRQVAIAAN